MIVTHNPCLSGGALEIFLDPQPVAPRIAIVGDTPIARALAAIARAAGYDVGAGPSSRGVDAALVVASHGEDEEVRARPPPCRPASATSRSSPRRKRGAAVLDVARRRRRAARRGPHARRPGHRRPHPRRHRDLDPRPADRPAHRHAARRRAVETATDPVCGMEVLAADADRPPRHRRRARLLLLRRLPVGIRSLKPGTRCAMCRRIAVSSDQARTMPGREGRAGLAQVPDPAGLGGHGLERELEARR